MSLDSVLYKAFHSRFSRFWEHTLHFFGYFSGVLIALFVLYHAES